MLCPMCNGHIDQAAKFCPFCGTPIVPKQTSYTEEFIDDYEELIDIDALIAEAQKQSEESNSYDEILASLERITGESVRGEKANPILADIPMVVVPKAEELPEEETVSVVEISSKDTPIVKQNVVNEDTEDISIAEVEPEIESKTLDTIEEKKRKKPIKAIIMLLLLALSMALNIILLSNITSKDMNIDKSKISENKIKVLSNKYYLWVPDNWISTTSPDGISTIFDESEVWATSFHFIENISYDMVADNIKAITDTFGENKYLFTSDYTKTVDDTDFVIFKGKYNEYVVYVIVASFDDNTIALADLKFKGEVSEDIVNSVMSALTTASTKDVSDVWKDNFKFDNVGDIITSAIMEENI